MRQLMIILTSLISCSSLFGQNEINDYLLEIDSAIDIDRPIVEGHMVINEQNSFIIYKHVLEDSLVMLHYEQGDHLDVFYNDTVLIKITSIIDNSIRYKCNHYSKK